jgi:hypothetical protein
LQDESFDLKARVRELEGAREFTARSPDEIKHELIPMLADMSDRQVNDFINDLMAELRTRAAARASEEYAAAMAEITNET